MARLPCRLLSWKLSGHGKRCRNRMPCDCIAHAGNGVYSGRSHPLYRPLPSELHAVGLHLSFMPLPWSMVSLVRVYSSIIPGCVAQPITGSAVAVTTLGGHNTSLYGCFAMRWLMVLLIDKSACTLVMTVCKVCQRRNRTVASP